MRKVKIEKWKAKDKDGNEYEESILTALNVLINNKKPEEIPRGLDKFRLFNRIVKAFNKAGGYENDEGKEIEGTGELVLEEADYKFLKDMVEKDIPSIWGANDNILKAIESFIEAKEA